MTLESDEPRPRSWRRATLFACGLTAILVAASLFSLEPESLHVKRVDVPPDIARCAADTECVLVDRIGCCPCRSGGARWAINKDAEQTLRRFLKHTCRGPAVCVQLNACRGDLVPACVDGRCSARVADG
jgi:hypothetical protein